MKILQLSDIHIGNWFNFVDEDGNLVEIVDKIIESWGNDDDKPVILVTGDVTDSGTKRQYKKARTIFQRLRNENFSLHFVPGNHDYGLKGNFAEKRKFKLFKKYLYGVDRISYPDARVIYGQNYNVALIGLNSMKDECEDFERFLADGKLGETQLLELEEILDDIDDAEEFEDKKYVKIVYLHHHPFILPEDRKNVFRLTIEKWVHALEDGADLMNELSNHRVDALLFGHDHDHVNFGEAADRETPLTEYYNIPCILSCGKSTKESNGKYPAWLLEIGDDGKIAVEDWTVG